MHGGKRRFMRDDFYGRSLGTPRCPDQFRFYSFRASFHSRNNPCASGKVEPITRDKDSIHCERDCGSGTSACVISGPFQRSANIVDKETQNGISWPGVFLELDFQNCFTEAQLTSAVGTGERGERACACKNTERARSRDAKAENASRIARVSRRGDRDSELGVSLGL